jgi:hypothetical protein
MNDMLKQTNFPPAGTKLIFKQSGFMGCITAKKGDIVTVVPCNISWGFHTTRLDGIDGVYLFSDDWRLGLEPMIDTDTPANRYRLVTEYAWEAWQAARETLAPVKGGSNER